ncbi:MAG: hypothetical protein JSR46_06470 [Verrucomicrobia bacterium]|nr:hypothetical protein [Verrucomicrobiota bacterium]
MTFREIDANIKLKKADNDRDRFVSTNKNTIKVLNENILAWEKYLLDPTKDQTNKIFKDKAARLATAKNMLEGLVKEKDRLFKESYAAREHYEYLIANRDLQTEVCIGNKKFVTPLPLNIGSPALEFNTWTTQRVKEKADKLFTNSHTENFYTNFAQSKLSFEEYCNKNEKAVREFAIREEEISALKKIIQDRHLPFENFTAKVVLEGDRNIDPRKSQQDTTGIGSDFKTVSSRSSLSKIVIKPAEEIIKEHLNLKLQIAYATLLVFERNKKDLFENGFTVCKYHKAIKTNKYNPDASDLGYENAHISIIPQVYLQKEDSNEIYKLSDIKISIDIEKYSGELKHIETSLDKLLNCANYAPKIINEIDMHIEERLRGMMDDSCNKIINHHSTVDKEYDHISIEMKNITSELVDYANSNKDIYHIEQNGRKRGHKIRYHYFSNIFDREIERQKIVPCANGNLGTKMITFGEAIREVNNRKVVTNANDFLFEKLIPAGDDFTHQIQYTMFKLENIISAETKRNAGKSTSISYNKNENMMFYIKQVILQIDEYFMEITRNKPMSVHQYVPEITRMFCGMITKVDENGNHTIEYNKYLFVMNYLMDQFFNKFQYQGQLATQEFF